MAGPFTHMLLCQRAADRSIVKRHGVQYSWDLLDVLNNHQAFMLMGAVTPDLPAVSDKLKKESWSDQMHNGRLNRAVVPIFAALKNAGSRDAKLAWLFGYVGHIVGDVVIHPIVQVAKTKSKDPANGHQQCEICQDVLSFKKIQSYDLTDATFLHGYMGWMNETTANHRAAFDETMTLWRDGLNQCGAGFTGNCADWYWSYLAAFEVAAHVPLVEAIAKRLPHPSQLTVRGFAYPNSANISDDDRTTFYDAAPLPVPPGSSGDFFDLAVELAVRRLSHIWQAMWTRLTDGQPGGIEDLIPDWDLNTGENRATQRAADLWVTT